MPSRGHDAISHEVIIALTGSARILAERERLDIAACARWLSPDCHAGDVVAVSAEGVQHDFAILRRRWLVGDAGRSLEITLDFPVRRR